MDNVALGTWAQIIALILKALSIIPRDRTKRSEHHEQTLRALSWAYHETEKYYASLSAGNANNLQMELDIAAAWEAAAILVERYDQTLAQRLGLKSRFWREGGIWTNEQIKQAGIQLERVRAEGMSLFKK
ncbi:MAG TPA: hypothetical protein PLG04_02415 [Anaerolineaceae bacterium]|nr:hypothetical protein [Anaerolineaceae bacterium]